MAQFDDDYSAEGANVSFALDYLAPNLSNALLGIKDEESPRPKEDFFEGFGRLFSNSKESSPQSPMMETVYYCEKWRKYAGQTLSPIADDMVHDAYASLCKYLEQLCDIYTSHIGMLINQIAAEREQVSAQLSEEERLLQADVDWHLVVDEKLHAIERL